VEIDRADTDSELTDRIGHAQMAIAIIAAQRRIGSVVSFHDAGGGAQAPPQLLDVPPTFGDATRTAVRAGVWLTDRPWPKI
jgi:hypothetical protein